MTKPGIAGLNPAPPRPSPLYRVFGEIIPEARDTFLALVPDRYKETPDAKAEEAR